MISREIKGQSKTLHFDVRNKASVTVFYKFIFHSFLPTLTCIELHIVWETSKVIFTRNYEAMKMNR